MSLLVTDARCATHSPHPPLWEPHGAQPTCTHPLPRPGGSVSQCISASGFVEYALSEGSKVTETETVSNEGGINTGARLPASLLAALSAAPPLGVCAASASLRAQGSSARRYPEEGATTRLTH